MPSSQSAPLEPVGPLDGESYRRIAGHWLTGAAVVTALSPSGAPVGLTMNAVSPLSLDPPMFLICLDLASDTLRAIEDTRAFCINFLAADGQDTCRAFARKGPDKFDQAPFAPGPLGLPVLDQSIAHVACVVDAIHSAGDHVIVVGVAHAGDACEGEPLVYFRGGFRELAG